ncbi:hypothetical protein HZS_7727 [Henneguya salminicola]|nr:hypothetical protein HZS_7727 [Henneguya salminicola]
MKEIDHIIQLSLYKRTELTRVEGNLYGKPSQGYYTVIYLGNPPQKLNVLIDTGSSNFAVAGKEFDAVSDYFNPNMSNTFISLNTAVEVPYTQGHWKGLLGSDIFKIPRGHILDDNSSQERSDISTRVKVALIHEFTNFFINGSEWNGILGLGYSRLSRPDSTILPPFDEMVLKQSIFGGIHKNLYIGDIFYTPIIRKWYYEVIITDIAIDGLPLGFNCAVYNNDRTIVDTGTTNFRVNEIIFDAIVEKIQGLEKMGIPNQFWQGYQVMCWAFGTTPFNMFPEITLSLSSTNSEYLEFRLLITPQLYLREANDDNSHNLTQNCYRFAISKSEKGIVIGAVFMEGFYVIFDRENSQIGFAKSNCGENGRLNINSKVFGTYKRNNSVRECYTGDNFEDTDNIIKLMIYVLTGITLISIIPPIFFILKAAVVFSREK